MAMSIDERQDLAMELYRSRHGGGNLSSLGTMSKRSTMPRKPMQPPPAVLGKSPPRPSPASVAYHSDEESLKGYDENPDDSSVTEKPSEISSSDSQVRISLVYLISRRFDEEILWNYLYFKAICYKIGIGIVLKFNPLADDISIYFIKCTQNYR